MSTRDQALIDFLVARATEDEEVAKAAIYRSRDGDLDRWVESSGNVHTALVGDPVAVGPWGGDIGSEAPHIARWDPARVIAEVRAKLAIIELHRYTTTEYPPRFDEFDPHSITACRGCREQREAVYGKPGCRHLRLLALPYAGHPEYREEWTP